MIEFAQPTKEDVLSIYPQLLQEDPESVSYGKEVFDKDLIPLDGCSMAAHDGGDCIGAYGFVEMWPGVARVWALFSGALLNTYPRVIALHTKRDLKRQELSGLHRIEATCDAEHYSARAFLEWLGFEPEGLMRRYTLTGKDSYLYAKVRDVI